MTNLAIFASGNGSNAENLINFFRNKNFKYNFYIFTNNKHAFVIERARKLNVECIIFDNKALKTTKLIFLLDKYNIDFIILAGFLKLIPADIVSRYKNKIVNIHPALLPKYGGKGMFGENVHKAVIQNKEKVSGITIHYVNEKYDEGDIIFQKEVEITNNDSPESLAKKIHELEYEYYPVVIAELLKNLDK